MATAAEQDLVVTRGDTLTIVVTITSDSTGTPINITGRTYRAQVRANADDPTTEASFTCTVTSGSAGQVTLSLSSTASALLSPGNHVWDLEETASGVVSTIVAGAFVVIADVTR